jgi:predicted transcriptional regulator
VTHEEWAIQVALDLLGRVCTRLPETSAEPTEHARMVRDAIRAAVDEWIAEQVAGRDFPPMAVEAKRAQLYAWLDQQAEEWKKGNWAPAPIQ